MHETLWARFVYVLPSALWGSEPVWVTPYEWVIGSDTVIRDMFDLYYWHPEFSIQKMRDNDPCKDKVMIDGFIVPIRMLSPELQEELRRRGIV